jgi:uncharacterized membrane protein
VTSERAEIAPRRASDGRTLTLVVAVLAAIGLGIAGYLTYVHYSDIEPVCTTGGCAKVQGSDYAALAGAPVALIGLLGYVGILLSLLVPGEAGRAATALLALVGFGYSAYLTYLELSVIDAICQWCVGSAIAMTAIAAVAVARLLRAP